MNDLPTHTRRATPGGPRAVQTVRKGLALGAMAAVLGCEGPGPTEIVDVGPAIEAPAMQAVEGQTTGARMLLYVHGGNVQQFVDGLVATGLLGDIVPRDMPDAPLPLSDFLEYHCVVVWTNGSPTSPVAQGDRLKEYADAGGRVILANFVYAPTTTTFGLAGGIMSPGYSPLVATAEALAQEDFPRSLDLSTALTDHELLDGVTDFRYGGRFNYSRVELDPGDAGGALPAVLVGSDNHGVPLIAVSASGGVVGINVYPLFATSEGVYRVFANACTAQSAVEVSVDIKPGANPNSINTRSAGIVPVAILGSAEFDVTDVDVTTLTFGPSGASPAHDLTVPATWADHLQDVNSDGFTDLVAHYRQDETGLEEGAEEGCVAGELTDGTSIEGCDAVRILEAGVSADRRRGPS